MIQTIQTTLTLHKLAQEYKMQYLYRPSILFIFQVHDFFFSVVQIFFNIPV